MKIYKNIFLAKDIDGFLTDREGQWLYSLARSSTDKGNIVEIGSWKGKSTVWLARGVRDSGAQRKIYAIDPHTGSPEHQKDGKVWTFDQFKKNIAHAGINELIKPIVKFSADAVKDITTPVGFLFIDGAHEYEAVSEDYRLYRPLVKDGGYIAFHDSPWPGVDKFLEEILGNDGFTDVTFTDSLFIGKKTAVLSSKDRFKNRLMLRLTREFQKMNNSSLPKPLKKIAKGLIKLGRDILSQL